MSKDELYPDAKFCPMCGSMKITVEDYVDNGSAIYICRNCDARVIIEDLSISDTEQLQSFWEAK